MEAIFSHKKKSDQKLFRDFISLDLDKKGCIPDASNDCSNLEKLFSQISSQKFSLTICNQLMYKCLGHVKDMSIVEYLHS